MNIGILRNTFLPLSETFIINQLKYIKQFEIKILTREVQNQDIFDYSNYDIGSVVNLKDNVLKQKFLRLFYTLTRKSCTLNEFIKSKDIKLLHAHFGVDAVYAIPFKRKYKIPLITTFHGMDITRLPKFTMYPISWLNYYINFNSLKKNGDLYIAVSNYIKDRLIELGFPKEKVIVHHIGIDIDEIPYVERRNKEEITILTVGRLTEKKGTTYLIDAFDNLYRQHKNIRLVIVGDGPLKGKLVNHMGKLQSKDKIIFKGALNYKEVIEEMISADIFCLPSITARDGDKEGLGMVQLEAAATGLPVIASDSGGISDGIIDGKTGYLVEEKNVNQITQMMDLLIKNSELRRVMGKNGRENMEKNFNLKTQSRILEEIYKETINK